MTEKNEIYSDEQLRLEIVEEPTEIVVQWLGKSIQRNPNVFLIPRLFEVMKRGVEENKTVIWDFSELEYMNSSTVTPVIKTLQMVKKGSGKVKLIYNKTKRWQVLSFAALRIFETKDGRIRIVGE